MMPVNQFLGEMGVNAPGVTGSAPVDDVVLVRLGGK